MTKAVVLLSGGQDSTTSLYWAKRALDEDINGDGGRTELHALTMFYGQRHKAEIDAARKIAGMAGCVSHEVMQVDALLGAKSALTDGSPIATDGGLPDAQAPGGLPTTFVPGRNLVFLALAVAHAARVGAEFIVTGVCQTDYSGYPDCRIEFIHAMQEAIRQAWPSGAKAPRILVPLMWLTKAQTVKLAIDLPGCMEALSQTITCYHGHKGGCHGLVSNLVPVKPCPACELRKRGFTEAGVIDPALPGIAVARDIGLPGGV